MTDQATIPSNAANIPSVETTGPNGADAAASTPVEDTASSTSVPSASEPSSTPTTETAPIVTDPNAAAAGAAAPTPVAPPDTAGTASTTPPAVDEIPNSSTSTDATASPAPVDEKPAHVEHAEANTHETLVQEVEFSMKSLLHKIEAGGEGVIKMIEHEYAQIKSFLGYTISTLKEKL